MELSRWNSPTLYNGWEAVTKRADRMECNTNWENVIDYTPQMKAAVGYAVTMEFTTNDAQGKEANPDAWKNWFEYLSSIPGPKIVMAKDLLAPNLRGAMAGELLAYCYRSFNVVGIVTDGAVRDIDEIAITGVKMLATRLMVGHGYPYPVRWGHEIGLLGTQIRPGMLVHADKYGFIAVPEDEQEHLLEASVYLDNLECETVISTAKNFQNKTAAQNLADIKNALDVQGEKITAFYQSVNPR
jgi:regulator of RNase E activity RraA